MRSTELPETEAPTRRVLVVLRWPVGGIRTYLLYNYPALLRAGYRFTFLGPADPSFQALAGELGGWTGAEFVAAPLAGRRCRLRPAIRDQLRGGRFALIHSQGLTAAAEVALANWGPRRVPHLVTSHDVFRPDQFPGAAGRARLWLLGRLLGRAEAIINVSEDARRNLLEYLPGLGRSRVRVEMIRNGIDTGRFAAEADSGPPPPDLRRRLGLGPEVRLLGFLGRFMEQKGFLPLLEALNRLQAAGAPAPFRLLAVGSGDYQREYRAETARRGLDPVVSFLGFEPDIGPILRQLDLLVMPSLWEACPLLPMEALAAGVPVLGSDCIGLREVLRGTPARTAPAGDPAAWAAALAAALADPGTATAAARAFAPAARARFDAAAPAQALVRLCEQLCPRPAAPEAAGPVPTPVSGRSG